MRSGFGCSVWPTPGRPLHGGRRPSGGALSCFCHCDGGLEELSGVFSGTVRAASRASSAAIRTSCDAMWANVASSLAVNAAIGVSFSAWFRRRRSRGRIHPTFRIDSAVVVSSGFQCQDSRTNRWACFRYAGLRAVSAVQVPRVMLFLRSSGLSARHTSLCSMPHNHRESRGAPAGMVAHYLPTRRLRPSLTRG